MASSDERSDGRDARLEQLAEALKDAQMMLLKQSEKLEQLSEGSGGDLDELRSQLAVVVAERDQLQRQLLALEKMQTETIALPDDDSITSGSQAGLPSIDELMSGLDAILEESEARKSGQQLNGPTAEAPIGDAEEMIAPEIIVPEAFVGESKVAATVTNRPTQRHLVYVDNEQPIKIAVRQGTMTIGRSESASIRVDSPYVSRIHARIITRGGETEIVDAGSTNGFKVNSIAVKRHRLAHGDVIMIGQRKLTFVDSSR